MKFCIEVWGSEYRKIKDTCILAERIGYDGYYYGESLTEIDLDCWTVIAGLAGVTRRIYLGPVITYLLPEYRNILLLAKQATSLQDITNGRLMFRTGVGADPHYAKPWWEPFGINYPDNKSRVSILDESLQILHLLWEGMQVQYNGKHWSIDHAMLARPDKRIPVTVAAMGKKSMRIAARYADIWEMSYTSMDDAVLMNKEFERLVRAYDRTVKRSIELDVIIAESSGQLEEKKNEIMKERGKDGFQQLLDSSLVGKPDAVVDKLRTYQHAGFQEFLLAFQNPFDTDALRLFIESAKTLS